MTTLTLHTVPLGTVIHNDKTSLCVYDESGSLIADYDFCTGLRLIKSHDSMSIYINDADLVPGQWSLLLTTVGEGRQENTAKFLGNKSGDPIDRIVAESPWMNCAPGPRVTWEERQSRLAMCLSCPLFNGSSMTCTKSGRAVLDVTTRADEYCPEGLWGDKQTVDEARVLEAEELGLPVAPATPAAVFTAADQAAFEAELDDYLGGLA